MPLETVKLSRNKKDLNDITVFGVFLVLAAEKMTPKTGSCEVIKVFRDNFSKTIVEMTKFLGVQAALILDLLWGILLCCGSLFQRPGLLFI